MHSRLLDFLLAAAVDLVGCMSGTSSKEKVKRLRQKRDAEGWARFELNIPPGPALDRLNALTGGDHRQRVKAIIALLERA